MKKFIIFVFFGEREISLKKTNSYTNRGYLTPLQSAKTWLTAKRGGSSKRTKGHNKLFPALANKSAVALPSRNVCWRFSSSKSWMKDLQSVIRAP